MFPNHRQELDSLKATGRLRAFTPVVGREGVSISYKGKKLIDFTNWDLFHINSNEDVLRVVHSELEHWGLGGNSPRLSSGSAPHHISLEKRLAKFLGYESSLLFSSRNQASLSLAIAILDERTFAFVDELSQSPIADAGYLVNANVVPFDTENPQSLSDELSKAPETARKVVFVEGVSPVRGTAADLAALIAISAKHAAIVIVDESFSLGVLGVRGGGAVEASGSVQRPYCCYGSLSFGYSGSGAFVACDSSLASYILNQSRTFLAEGAMPAAFAAGMETALDVIELSGAGRERIGILGSRMRRGLMDCGAHVSEEALPLVCVPFPSKDEASEMAAALMERGFLVEVASKGAVRDSAVILRLLINTSHTEAHVDSLLQAFSDVISRTRKL